MKKLVSILIVSLLLAPSLLACSQFTQAPAPKSTLIPAPPRTTGQSTTPKPSGQPAAPPAQKINPFTFDYALSDSNIAFFTKGDDIMTLAAAGPFYSGSQPLPFPTARDYENTRTAKVAEIVKEADTLAQAVSRLKPQMAAMRTAFLAYLSTVHKEEPKLGSFVKETLSQVSSLATREQYAETEFTSFGKSGAKRSLAASLTDYLRVAKAMELGSLYLEDTNNILAYSAVVLKAADNHPKTSIKNANAQLDKDTLAADGMRKDLSVVASSVEKINYGIKQLATGTYYFSKAANDFMAASLPDLKAKVAGLTPRDGLTADQIQAIRSYLGLVEKWHAQMRQRTDSIDKSKLIALRPEKQGPFVFVAVEPADDYVSAVAALKAPMKAPEPPSSGYLARGWNTIKTTYQGAQTAVGVTLDGVGAVVGNTARLGYGLAYGNSAREIIKDQTDNWKKVADNYKNANSGVETLRTAGEYLEGVETAAREKVQDAGTSVTGLGDAFVLPWAAGAITQATVGMFTGLGKGLYKLGDRQADAVKIVEGTLDVGLSFIGGSKVAVKGSQVPGVVKGIADEAKLTGKVAIGYIESVFNDRAAKAITKESAELLARNQLTSAAASKLISNSAQLEVRAELAATLAAARDRMTQEMAQILRTGGSAALAGAKETIAGSIEDTFKKQFENSLKGLLEAAKNVVGTSAKDYMDNLVGGWADDIIKGQITSMVADSGSSGSFQLAISPPKVDMKPSGQQVFQVTVTGVSMSPIIQWSADAGTISSQGLSATYTAPGAGGTYKITAKATVGGQTQQATAVVNVVGGTWTLVSTVPSAATVSPATYPISRVPLSVTNNSVSYEGPNPKIDGTSLVYKWRFTWSDPPASFKPGDMVKGTATVEETIGMSGSPKDGYSTAMKINGMGVLGIVAHQMAVGSATVPLVVVISTGENRTLTGRGGYEFRAQGSGSKSGVKMTIVAAWTLNVRNDVLGYDSVHGGTTYTYELR